MQIQVPIKKERENANYLRDIVCTWRGQDMHNGTSEYLPESEMSIFDPKAFVWV